MPTKEEGFQEEFPGCPNCGEKEQIEAREPSYKLAIAICLKCDHRYYVEIAKIQKEEKPTPNVRRHNHKKYSGLYKRAVRKDAGKKRET